MCRHWWLHMALQDVWMDINATEKKNLLVPRAGFQILNDRSGLWVPLCNLEGTEVFLSCIALINSSEDVDVLVFRVRHPTPRQFHRSRLYMLHIQSDVESVQICNKNDRTNSMQPSPSCEASSHSAIYELPKFYGTRMFIKVFTRSRYWFLFLARLIQSLLPHHFL
jgi:hypothetical protein